jgi:hypothetical protein
MDTVDGRPKPGATVSALGALLLGLYSALAVATFWGALGGLAGGFGALLSVWSLRQRPGRPTRVLAVVALVLNLLAFGLAALLIVLVLAGEI